MLFFSSLPHNHNIINMTMFIKDFLFVVFYAILFSPFATADDLVVTRSGKIQGKTVFHNDIPVRAFLGIPYAVPPLGNLRFKKPLPVNPWTETLQALKLPPGCVQYSSKPFPWLDDSPGLSENCLYLNIWTPANGNSSVKKSVMFWIHIGGFRVSSSRLDIFNGVALAAEGDVVVVTINYRLGAEGFFFSGTDDAPGNVGVWDMIEALRWVKDNIEFFGGDPDSITLVGHSAGGMAIGMFSVSPITRGKGLFKRAIMQSGSATNLFGEDNEKTTRISQKLAKAVGCAPEENALNEYPQNVVDCMRHKDPFVVAVALSNVTAKMSRGYYPRFGDELLPTDPRKAIIEGDFEPVDVLIGSNDGDGATLITKSMKDVFGFFGEKDPQINLTFGESIIRNKFKDYRDPDAVVEQYLGDVEEDDYYAIREKVFTATGDYSRTCPTVYLAESYSKKNVNVYYYYFTRRPSNSPWAPWMLAAHFEETPFVFGYPLRYPQEYTVEEQILSRQMIRAWSTFAKTGNPAYGTWSRYSKEYPVYQVLDVDNTDVGLGPHRSDCDFFHSDFES